VPQIHLRHYKLAVIDCLCVPGTDVEDPAPLALGAGSLSEKEIGSGNWSQLQLPSVVSHCLSGQQGLLAHITTSATFSIGFSTAN